MNRTKIRVRTSCNKG